MQISKDGGRNVGWRQEWRARSAASTCLDHIRYFGLKMVDLRVKRRLFTALHVDDSLNMRHRNLLALSARSAKRLEPSRPAASSCASSYHLHRAPAPHLSHSQVGKYTALFVFYLLNAGLG
jgi:hypothetical protein